LQVVTDTMEVGVVRCSRDLRYIWVSRGYAVWMGRDPGEIAGHPIFDVIGQEGFDAIRPHIEKVLSGERVEYEAKVTFLGTGTRWIHAVLVPTKDPDNTVDGWIAVVTDVTERHDSEDRLRQSEELFRSVANAAPVMIWMSGTDKLCTFFNKGWLDFTGRALEQELGNGWAGGVHPDDLDRCLAVYTSSFDARDNFQMEYRLRRADGVYRWVLDHGIPLFAPGGVLQGYIGSCLDITDLKLAQEASLGRQKLESVGVLAAGIAHDFNNLLGSIVVDTDLALAAMNGGPPPLEEIQRIKTVAFRASEIVRELMVYSGQETAQFEPVRIPQLVQEMIELLKVSISKHATLRTSFQKDLPPIRGHASEIRQIVMNLIINASEAIGETHGAIVVAASRVTGGKELAPCSAVELHPGDYVRLDVSDTGHGMTAEQSRRIFDPFFTTKFAGRGLGLAVVDGAVRAHDGAINVLSAPGQGTTFQVFLPCWADPARRVESANAAPPAGNAAGRVLFVEDENLLRRPIAKRLRNERFSVLEAADGAAAIQLLRERAHEIDLMLLDLTIPGAESREVIQEAYRIRPGMKVVVVSAHSKEWALRSIRGLKIAAFVRKPFQLAELVRVLRENLPQMPAALSRGV
jgi:PAS domain S-box-containing protein